MALSIISRGQLGRYKDAIEASVITYLYMLFPIRATFYSSSLYCPKMHEDGVGDALSVLFGPQGTVTAKSMEETRELLHDNPDLYFLLETISELQDLWPVIQDVWPRLDRLSAQKKLASLSDFFQGGPPPTLSGPINNILLSPLTVISQIIEFWKLSHGFDNRPSKESQLRDVQGFCLGFLTATTVSCSTNETQFKSLAPKAVRLALCMGALVDLDALTSSNGHDYASAIAVRWKSPTQMEHFKDILKLFPSVSHVQ